MADDNDERPPGGPPLDLAAVAKLIADNRALFQALLVPAVPSPVAPSSPATMTIRQLWQRYWRIEGSTLASARTEIGRMKVIFEIDVLLDGKLVRFGDVEIGQVTPDTWIDLRTRHQKMKTKYRQPPRPGTRNRCFARVKRLLQWATEPGQRFLPDNPLRGVPMEPEDNIKLGKIANEEQLEHLLGYCDVGRGALKNPGHTAIMRAFILVGIDTGMREEEICDLKWFAVDEETGRINIRAFKRKNKHMLAPMLSSRGLAAVLALPRHGEYVFANPATRRRYGARWMSRLFEEVVNASGMTGPNGESITPHTLRHSFAYLMRRRGIPESVVQQMLGQKTRAAFVRYGIVDQAEMDAGYKLRDERIEAERMAIIDRRIGPRAATTPDAQGERSPTVAPPAPTRSRRQPR